MSTQQSPSTDNSPATLAHADGLLTEEQLAQELHVSPRTLQRQRQEGWGIPFIRFGRRVLYRRSDAHAYLAEHIFTSTAAASEQHQALLQLAQARRTLPAPAKTNTFRERRVLPTRRNKGGKAGKGGGL